ncbi:hypothetical protein CDD83_6655 [Cordyceps sp. RAO-2017]|nr:hypothetical protein CDD83_6655 [Cordyceps sp. RAO-2017]
MVMTRSKRAKRILRCLSAAQHEDHNLSGSVTPLIRYNLLHDYHRCIQVSVELGASTDRFPTAFSFGAMPNFLRSQLEAQKIADGSRLWSQVVPLLTFIHANLRRFEKSRGFPTLFTWHSRENHRSYFFFAFVEIRMVSKIYTARELLRLRKASAGKDFYHRLLDKLRRDTGLGEIFRVQPGGGSLPLIKEEDVAVSDKANPGLAKNAVPRQLDGTDSEWKYRGRIEYEEDTAHPICGPAGFSAQKDEGFQRFYKAVVSPTHVRVTAGGRIVPNTRGSSSPTAKWSKDKTPSDAAATSKGAGREQLEHFPFPIPQASFGAYPPMIPGFAPGMAAAHASFPMMPWHIGVNMGGAFGMVHPQMASMSMAGSMSSAVSLKSDKQSETGNSDTANSVRISPPEQFDHNRPFFYNGQWMMPHGAAMFPLGMPPIAGYSVPMAGQAIMHPRYGMHPMMNIHAMRSDSSPYSQTAPAPGASTHVGASPPPISSIRQSEITKRQLENLRSHLRFLEDQLQYNRHQIDEKLMEQQTQVLRQQIHLFEKNLEAQLTAEESQNSKAENTEESVSSASSRDGFGPKSSAASDCKPGKDSNSASGSRDDTPQARPVHEQKSANSIAAQPPPAPASSAKPAPLKSALKKPRATEPTKKASALPFIHRH